MTTPLKKKKYEFGKYELQMQQFDKDIHLPTTVGCHMANILCNICDKSIPSDYLQFDANKIKMVCDIGCGAGHFSILCDKLFYNLNNMVAVDLLSESLIHTSFNWKLNNCRDNKLTLLQSNVAYFFHDIYFGKYDEINSTKFDFIICNPPNLGSDAGEIMDDIFHVNPHDDTGRFFLDKLLLESYKCLNYGGYILTTDTSLNYSHKTDDILNNILNLTKNKDWIVIKEIEMDFPFMNRYKNQITKQWIKQLLHTKRLFLNQQKYTQRRRYILIKKPFIPRNKL
eukprot:482726_1